MVPLEKVDGYIVQYCIFLKLLIARNVSLLNSYLFFPRMLVHSRIKSSNIIRRDTGMIEVTAEMNLVVWLTAQNSHIQERYNNSRRI
jgi:hypothetical protein